MSDLFTDADLIYSYTRAQAIKDGVLYDANVGDLAEVTRQHFKIPVAMTAAVFAIIRKAVENKRWCNDYLGVWHDICWMAFLAARRCSGSEMRFQVIITGTGPRKIHTFKAVIGPMGPEDASPCLTIMLPEED